MYIKKTAYSILLSLAIIISAVSIGSMGGCTSGQTRKNAVAAEKLSDDLAATAIKVRVFVDRYDVREITEGDLVAMVLNTLPETWQGRFSDAIVTYNSVRDAALEIADSMDVTAQDAAASAVDLHAQADDESASKWDNFMAITEGVVGAVVNPQGVVASALGLLALHLRRRVKKADAEVVTTSKTAIQMRDVAENLTLSLEAFKSTPEGRGAWESVGRGVVANAQSPTAQGFVKAVKARKEIIEMDFGVAVEEDTEIEKPSVSPPSPENYDENGNPK